MTMVSVTCDKVDCVYRERHGLCKAHDIKLFEKSLGSGKYVLECAQFEKKWMNDSEKAFLDFYRSIKK